jgi:ATPase subunit of ABC transporter with duplicated ATPase domains
MELDAAADFERLEGFLGRWRGTPMFVTHDRTFLRRMADRILEIDRGRSHPGLLPLANLRFEVSRLRPAVSFQPDVTATTKGTRAETPPPPSP